MILAGHKVVAADEMSRIEELAYARGFQEQVFMESAGDAVAASVSADFVTLFVGKGNNGGDAYAAGVKLLERGIQVSAFHFFPLESCSPLCKMQHDRFVRSKGQVVLSLSPEEIPTVTRGIIIDGLVGTGFHGKAEGILASAIQAANHSNLPIVAIDIPSGVNGTTGAVETVAILAKKTICLGLPKIGLFIGQGWNHVGELVVADFGLPKESVDAAKEKAFLLNEAAIKEHLPEIKRNQHKYQRGYVVAVAGSPTMTGAALLSSFSSLRSGAGIVRLFHLQEMHMGDTHPEIIHEQIDLSHKEKILEEAKRAKAVLIGPGLGRTPEAKDLLTFLLPRFELPCVIDADALFFLSENPATQLPPNVVLTPHRGEMERLLGKKFEDDLTFLDAAQAFVEKQKTTLVLKGSPTMILQPQSPPLIIPRGDPGMATAGAGDVLTGVIAAFLAHSIVPYVASVLGVYLHALAGEIAAKNKTSHCVVASDLIDSLPAAYKTI